MSWTRNFCSTSTRTPPTRDASWRDMYASKSSFPIRRDLLETLSVRLPPTKGKAIPTPAMLQFDGAAAQFVLQLAHEPAVLLHRADRHPHPRGHLVAAHRSHDHAAP